MISSRIFTLLLAGTILSGCGDKAPTQPSAPPPQEVGVITIRPERTEIVTELPGRTAAFRVAEVRPQVSGIILERLFEEGGDAKAGQQLYQIDPATYQAAVDSAEATVARAEAAVDIAKLRLQRQERLVQTDVISQQDYDDTSVALKQAEADLAAAKADRERARIDLRYTKVLSPISGTIGRSMVTEGALVTSEQQDSLATVHQLDPIYVDVTQSSGQLLRLQRELAAGQLQDVSDQQATARLILEDGTVYSEAGTLAFSEVSVDEGTGSVTLRAVFPNPRRELLPGMFVRTMVTEGVDEAAILVSQRGVTRNQRGESVALVVGEGNRVESRVVQTDRAIGDRWLVTEGLEPGDRVIIEGLQKTGPGAEVNPVEMTEGASSTAMPEPADKETSG